MSVHVCGIQLTRFWCPDCGTGCEGPKAYGDCSHCPLVHVVRVKACDLQGGGGTGVGEHQSSYHLSHVDPVLHDEPILVISWRWSPRAEDGLGISHDSCWHLGGTGGDYVCMLCVCVYVCVCMCACVSVMCK